ncbi:hypothetical protein AYO20_05942 [Fonsecaea nubica]|uniref:Ecp2 effector protein domain-containing protein n=1 Tax=Fonsecaea nubica TaxID=856822 RepID=A0A178CZD0_9EURO|nr:hypothetical protein AYO20_05942 [Fonsecaea nubica]OAL34747.1 hypothetical protein AYO20_05942 [Fonsecaea nubica]
MRSLYFSLCTFVLSLISSAPFSAAENGILFNVTDALTGENSPRKLGDRAVNGIYICQYPHWGGTCFWTPISSSSYNQCGIVTSHGGWASIGPDKDVKVDLYRDTACQQPFWKGLVNPGSDNVPAQVAARGLPPVTGDVFGAVFRAL